MGKVRTAQPKARNLMEQLAALDNTAPDDFDPEDVGYEDALDMGRSFDDSKPYAKADVATTARMQAPSNLRARAHGGIVMDDPAYKGKKSSRKQMGYSEPGCMHLFCVFLNYLKYVLRMFLWR